MVPLPARCPRSSRRRECPDYRGSTTTQCVSLLTLHLSELWWPCIRLRNVSDSAAGAATSRGVAGDDWRLANTGRVGGCDAREHVPDHESKHQRKQHCDDPRHWSGRCTAHVLSEFHECFEPPSPWMSASQFAP